MPDYTTTTRLGLRWLRGTNLISDIDAGFQALAEDVDSKLGASAWEALALAAHITTDSGPDPIASARLDVNGTVRFQGILYADSTGVAGGGTLTIATLPADLRPARSRLVGAVMTPTSPGASVGQVLLINAGTGIISPYNTFVSYTMPLEGLSFSID